MILVDAVAVNLHGCRTSRLLSHDETTPVLVQM